MDDAHSYGEHCPDGCTECQMIGSESCPEHNGASPKIDGRMSDGAIYEAASRRANQEAHSRIDALIAKILTHNT